MKRPFFPFYTADFLASKAVATMTPAQIGGYILLLCHAWAEDDCGLPDDDEELALLSKLGPEWATAGPRIRKHFLADPARPGRLFNDRLNRELAECEARSEKASMAGRASAASKRNDRSTQAQPEVNGRSTQVQRSLTPSSTKVEQNTDLSHSHSHSHSQEDRTPDYSPEPDKPASGRVVVASPEPPEEFACPEPLAPEPQPAEPPVMVFPVIGPGSRDWPLVPSKLAEWAESYPGVDVQAECRKARQWLADNPARRKTAKGMAKFLGGWIERSTNRGRASPNGNGHHNGNGRHAAGADSMARWSADMDAQIAQADAEMEARIASGAPLIPEDDLEF